MGMDWQDKLTKLDPETARQVLWGVLELLDLATDDDGSIDGDVFVGELAHHLAEAGLWAKE